MTVTILQPTDVMLQQLASRLCLEDRDELAACGWATPLEALRASVESSREAYVACWDGLPQAAFGVADFTLDDSLGVPWLLSTGPDDRAAREFLRIPRRYIAEWKLLYSALFNFVDARHLRAQRWLLSLGFQPFKVHDYNGLPFIEFGVHSHL